MEQYMAISKTYKVRTLDKIDDFYKKIKGGYFALLGALIGFLTVTISLALFIQIEPSFSFFTHYISDIGDARGLPGIIWEIGMLVGLTPVRLLFLIYLVRFLQKMGANNKLIVLAFVFSMISITGSVLMATTPFHVSEAIHIMSAFVYFIGVWFSQIFFSTAELKIAKFPKHLPISGFSVVLFYGIFTTLLILYKVAGFDRNLPVFWQWLSFVAILIWLVLHGLYTLKVEKKMVV